MYPEVDLAKAREDRDKARKLLAAGNDPVADRKVDKLIRVTASGTQGRPYWATNNMPCGSWSAAAFPMPTTTGVRCPVDRSSCIT